MGRRIPGFQGMPKKLLQPRIRLLEKPHALQGDLKTNIGGEAMKFNKRLLLETIIVSCLLPVLLVTGSMIYGMLMTRANVPDVTASYMTGSPLPSQVSFGTITVIGGVMEYVIAAAGLLLFGFTYYVVRSFIQRRMQRS